jgi:hypothetical protein
LSPSREAIPLIRPLFIIAEEVAYKGGFMYSNSNDIKKECKLDLFKSNWWLKSNSALFIYFEIVVWLFSESS